MHVDAVELHRVQIPFRRAFEHALHERRCSDAVLVCVHARAAQGPVVGWGEILPRAYVTGETIGSVLEREAPRLAKALLGRSFQGFADAKQWLEMQAEAAGERLATVCGFDLALLDAVGQATATPVAAALGTPSLPELPAGVIIGFEHPTAKLARYCAALRLRGRRHIKVKVGLDDDVERLRAIASVFKDLPLRLDANAAWTAQEAIARMPALVEACGAVESVEQPVPASDVEGLRRVQEATGVPVMADESVCSLADAQRLIDAGAASIFNVRLGKNGGLWAAHRLCVRARRAGVALHLGTMVGESGVLSRASEIFGRCEPGFACLDGKGQNAFLLELDILDESRHHPTQADVGTGHLDAPGLGVHISPARLQKHRVGNVYRFEASTTNQL